MAIIYKKTDRLKLKVDDLTLTLAPLTREQKVKAQALIASGQISKDYPKITEGLILLIKHSLKNIEGAENPDGSPYVLEFDDDVLKSSCIDDLFNLNSHAKLVMLFSSLTGSFPPKLTDHKGQPLDGVQFL